MGLHITKWSCKQCILRSNYGEPQVLLKLMNFRSYQLMPHWAMVRVTRDASHHFLNSPGIPIPALLPGAEIRQQEKYVSNCTRRGHFARSDLPSSDPSMYQGIISPKPPKAIALLLDQRGTALVSIRIGLECGSFYMNAIGCVGLHGT